jgi:hypothetical protein
MKNQLSRRHFVKAAAVTSAAVVAATHGLNASESGDSFTGSC